MASRVTPKEVTDILWDYDADKGINVQQFINLATELTDDLASKDTGSVLTATRLKQIELLLSAHYFGLADPRLKSENTSGAGGSYVQRSYLEEAYSLDRSGNLRRLMKGTKPSGVQWLGKPPSDQIDYVDRD